MTPPDRSPQHRQYRSGQLRRSASLVRLLDQAFFIFAGVATVWLAVLVFLYSWQVGWWYVVFFLLFWIVVAYFALPRLHRILSQIYVPNYFFGRTRTSDGLLGDPVNLALRGNADQVHAAMLRAGWVRADDLTARSTWRMMMALLTRRSYHQAPVSPLLLFGRPQDFAYQQEVDGSPGKRHHVRFWRCPKGWLLPGGHQVDWLAAGTYDKSVGVSLFTLQITHKIDENTDIERDYIVASVRRANAAADLTVIHDFSTGYHSRNGGGDTIITDGHLPVLELGRLRPREKSDDTGHDVVLDATYHADSHTALADESFTRELWAKRPLQMWVGAVLMVGVVVALVAEVVIELLNWDRVVTETARQVEPLPGVDMTAVTGGLLGLLMATIVAAAIVETWLSVLALRGSDRARLGLLVTASAVIMMYAVQFFVYRQPVALGMPLLTVGLQISIVLALSSDAARQFTRSRGRHWRRWRQSGNDLITDDALPEDE